MHLRGSHCLVAGGARFTKEVNESDVGAAAS